MQEILNYIGNYFRHVNKKVLVLCSLQTAVLIYFNYHHELERWLTTCQILAWPAFTGRYLLFMIAFALPYFFYVFIEKKKIFRNKPFIFLLVAAPAIFALKMALNTELPFSSDWYWN